VNDCTQWLAEVGSNLPSVVPLATDESGMNLPGVTLTIDGDGVARPVTGLAVDLDPGPHRFTFAKAGFDKTEIEALVAVGEQNKRVAVKLRKSAPTAVAAPVRDTVTPASVKTSSSPLKPIGIVIAATGVATIAAGAIFGGLAIAKKSDAGCSGNICPPGSNPDALRDAVTDGNVSTALFIAGGVVAAAGATTWLLAPSRPSSGSAWFRAAPVALERGGALVVVGAW
jgi:hypothetical protein